jgi:CheY-like chemotaxis protein
VEGRTVTLLSILNGIFLGLKLLSASMTLPEDAVILLAEDLENDVLLVQRALEKAAVTNRLFVVRDGEEALAYLHGLEKFSDRDEYPLPNILLLDLKMPKVNGFEVLTEIRKNPEFAALRVIVLTSSEEIFEVNKCYEMGANSFLVKPIEFENLTAMMRTLASFWLHSSKILTITDRPKMRNGNGHSDPAGK